MRRGDIHQAHNQHNLHSLILSRTLSLALKRDLFIQSNINTKGQIFNIFQITILMQIGLLIRFPRRFEELKALHSRLWLKIRALCDIYRISFLLFYSKCLSTILQDFIQNMMISSLKTSFSLGSLKQQMGIQHSRQKCLGILGDHLLEPT